MPTDNDYISDDYTDHHSTALEDAADMLYSLQLDADTIADMTSIQFD